MNFYWVWNNNNINSGYMSSVISHFVTYLNSDYVDKFQNLLTIHNISLFLGKKWSYHNLGVLTLLD